MQLKHPWEFVGYGKGMRGMVFEMISGYAVQNVDPVHQRDKRNFHFMQTRMKSLYEIVDFSKTALHIRFKLWNSRPHTFSDSFCLTSLDYLIKLEEFFSFKNIYEIFFTLGKYLLKTLLTLKINKEITIKAFLSKGTWRTSEDKFP